GTLALELLEAVPDLDAVVAPCGGGGLLSGISVVFAALRADAAVWGVEPAAGDDMQRSLAAGEPVEIAQPRTIADSLQTTKPALRTLAHIAALTRGVVLVSDDELRAAVAFAFERLKVVVEPGGAAALAALLAGRVPEVSGKRVGVVLSGGNLNLPNVLTS
ncbi:MAG: pyridoxal-phosphate dependent enzyme, partial [Acidobacteria bacterium]|nr:pyridoxal-phosphate dependent enzyme [Acidobacteriota bacterium]